MEPLAAAAASAACLAVAVAGYQLYFFLKRRARRDALWAGVMSVGAAVYAACQAVTYETRSDEVARSAVALSFVGMTALVTAVPAFAGALVGRPVPGFRVVGPLAFAVLSGLILGTGLVVAPTIEPIALTALGHPYPQPAPAPLTAPFLVYCPLVSGLGVAWLARWRERGKAPDALLVAGMALWIAAGIVDSATVLGHLAAPPMFFAEHGVVAFVLALFARNVRDHVDALRAQEEALAASEASFRQLIEQSPEMIAVHRDGAFVYANPAAVRGLGRASAEELVGTRVLDVVHPDDRAVARARAGAAGGAEGWADAVEQRLLGPGGEAFVAEVHSLPVTFEERPAVLVVARDLTEQRRLEAKMMQLDRMVSVGTLAAGVAHEVNNPLTFVMGNLEATLADLGGLESTAAAREVLEPLRVSLEDAREGAERIRDIVADLSFLARAPARERRPFLLSSVVDRAVKLARHEVAPRARLVRHDEPSEPVLGDAARLCQVALNLVVNAAQSIPLEASPAGEVRVSTGMRGGRALLEVSDTGAGIPEELRGRVFEPFVTTKAPGEGTGLGLAISRRIVADHGGEIELESEVGRGTTVRVLLPPAPEGAAVEPSPPLRRSPGPPGRGRVLVVDEEPMICRLMERILGAEHDVVAAASPAEALERLEASASYDVLFFDLPTLEPAGPGFLAGLAERWPELAPRVVPLTGGGRGGEALEGLDGIDRPPLRKPFDAKTLTALVRELVEGPAAGRPGGVSARGS